MHEDDDESDDRSVESEDRHVTFNTARRPSIKSKPLPGAVQGAAAVAAVAAVTTAASATAAILAQPPLRSATDGMTSGGGASAPLQLSDIRGTGAGALGITTTVTMSPTSPDAAVALSATEGGLRQRNAAAHRRSALSPEDLKYHNAEELMRVTAPPDDLTLFNCTPSAIIVATTVGLIVNANAYAHRMLHYDRGQLIGRPLEIIMPKDFREGHRAMMECVARARV